MQKIQKKGWKQYFFAGVLLLSLSANIVKGADEGVGDGNLERSMWEQQRSVWKQQIIISLTTCLLNTFVVPVIKEYAGEFLQDKFRSLVRRDKIIIRSSKDNSEKPDQEMIFSGEVKLKLDDFVAITKKINEKRKKNSMVEYRNLLFHGSPGTGKTMFAEKLARRLHSDCGMEWIMITGSGFFQSHEAIRTVRDVFIDEVKRNKKKGTIIIIDEADSLFYPRENLSPDSLSYQVMNQLLSFLGDKTNDRVVVMTSNNLILDSAMQRRMDDAIEVPLPGNKERAETLRLYKKSFGLENLTDEKIEEIAHNTEGFSQSDLSGIVGKLKMKFDIDDTNIEENADIIVKEYHAKKQFFVEQQSNKDRNRLEALKRKAQGTAAVR